MPAHGVLTEVPKTSTGTIQKFKLREMARAL
jgi:acyl-CoA synthetase (AMP-forming)/AMP-acid ligase II